MRARQRKPNVTVRITPSDFDVAAILCDTDGNLSVQLPDEVRNAVRTMCNQRVEGALSVEISIEGFVR